MVDSERFDVTTRAGEPVEVSYTNAQVTIRYQGEVYAPRWGSQASDDWLDWMWAQREGRGDPLPIDEPDWLLDEGYHNPDL